MDWGSIGGIVLALLAILAGQAIEGGRIGSLMQPAAFLIVFFGTIGAVLVQTKTKSFLKGLVLSKFAFMPPKDDREALAKQIMEWSTVARKEGVLGLEPFMLEATDPYVKRGLLLMVDGTTPEKIREICAIDLHFHEAQLRSAVKIWDAAGGYAPTIGILGAVIGLIHVMENLSNPNLLGSGIAVAFVATVYGVGLANIVFLPIANKLKSYIQFDLMRREMLLNAWVSITRGDHPKTVEERLQAYLK